MFRFLEEALDRIDGSDETESYILSKKYNTEFGFDWNNYKTHKSSEAKLNNGILEFINDSIANGSYRQANAAPFGDLCYKVGTYFNHIKRDPIKAMQLHNIALMECTTNQAWIHNHLAFSFQQKLPAAKKANNADEIQENYTWAMKNCQSARDSKNLASASANEKIKIEAFSYCVEALVQYEMGNMEKALATYRKALDMYEDHKLLDDQYARAKNRWAMMLNENKQVEEAGQAYAELAEYWKANLDRENIYAPRFNTGYAEFLEATKPQDLQNIYDQYYAAYLSLRHNDGEADKFTQAALSKVIVYQNKLAEITAHHAKSLFASNAGQSSVIPAAEVSEVSELDEKNNPPSPTR